MRCAKKNCIQIGLISLSELCNTPYHGSDTLLLFCEDHVLEMLFYYKEFKDFEMSCGLIPFIKCPFSVFVNHMSDKKLHNLCTWIEKALNMRKEFQSQLVCANSQGHTHWMSNMQQCIDYCDLRLWHPVCSHKRRYKHRHKPPNGLMLDDSESWL